MVHGDFRIGNVIFGPEGLRAVLDWELAHVGDPFDDLGWLCLRSWRFGADGNPVGGLCERERFFAAYERAGGGRVDAAAVRWWETFGNLKWAIMCIMQAKTFLDGAVRSVELAPAAHWFFSEMSLLFSSIKRACSWMRRFCSSINAFW